MEHLLRPGTLLSVLSALRHLLHTFYGPIHRFLSIYIFKNLKMRTSNLKELAELEFKLGMGWQLWGCNLPKKIF